MDTQVTITKFAYILPNYTYACEHQKPSTILIFCYQFLLQYLQIFFKQP